MGSFISMDSLMRKLPMLPRRTGKSNIVFGFERTPTEMEDQDLLFAWKRAEYLSKVELKHSSATNILTPQENQTTNIKEDKNPTAASRIKTIASMVPDEILYNVSDYSIREYGAALMFCDVSGFTELCDRYAKVGRDGSSLLTLVLNSFIGSMVQEILSHNGDLLKFSGDAFLAMWKSSDKLNMQDAVHAAIDCGLIIQKHYGTYQTDVGVSLRVKVAISGGRVHFASIGDEYKSHYAVVGQPVWDVKFAEYLCAAGDVVASPSAWIYVNEAEYATELADKLHKKIIGVGPLWQRVGKMGTAIDGTPEISDTDDTTADVSADPSQSSFRAYPLISANKRELSIRPTVNYAIQENMLEELRRYTFDPVMNAVERDEPMEYLTEMRQVVIVFLNIVVKVISEKNLITTLNTSYINVVRFPYKNEDECESALKCAAEIKLALSLEEHFNSVSLGVTTGVTYCGVVGHILRREYTVIGLVVNKAARLMVAYPGRVTCDTETFLRSKLHQDNFKLMIPKPLKGMTNVGPIYEYKEMETQENSSSLAQFPMLGRDHELSIFHNILRQFSARHETAIETDDITNVLAITGVKKIGKSRLLEEMLLSVPKKFAKTKIILHSSDTAKPFFAIQQIFGPILDVNMNSANSILRENKISRLIQEKKNLAYLNAVFNCHFHGSSEQMLYDEYSEETYEIIEHILIDILKACSQKPWIICIHGGYYMDEWSSKILPSLIEADVIVILINLIHDEFHIDTEIVSLALRSNKVRWLQLLPIDKWYHAAIACQALGVDAISVDLERVIQANSTGNTGWIRSFVTSLIHSGNLKIQDVTCDQTGLVVPPKSMMVRTQSDDGYLEEGINEKSSWKLFEEIFNKGVAERRHSKTMGKGFLKAAILATSYNFSEMESCLATDALILKTYDSLNPFEQLVLKCSSVLGDVFSRFILEYVMRIRDKRNLATAIAKLFSMRVLVCEAADFSSHTKVSTLQGVLFSRKSSRIRADMMSLPSSTNDKTTGSNKIKCYCMGIFVEDINQDLPKYAFCGFMKFRETAFRETTYNLLTETQKRDFHGRAAMYMEKNTRRCDSCGHIAFSTLLGVKSSDGFNQDSEDIPGLTHYKQLLSEKLDFKPIAPKPEETENLFLREQRQRRQSYTSSRIFESLASNQLPPLKRYSALNREDCDCAMILSSTYFQMITHCKGAKLMKKMIEGYIEYSDFCIQSGNVPHAIRLLEILEEFASGTEYKSMVQDDDPDWSSYRIKFLLGRVMNMKGKAAIEIKDYNHATKCLARALDLLRFDFPPKLLKMKIHWMRFQNFLTLTSSSDQFRIPNIPGYTASYYNLVADIITNYFTIYFIAHNQDLSILSANLAWHMAKKANNDFRILCVTHANLLMISAVTNDVTMTRNQALERSAFCLCHKKQTIPDILELPDLAKLYIGFIRFKMWQNDYNVAFKIGETAMNKLLPTEFINQRQEIALMLLWIIIGSGSIFKGVIMLIDNFKYSDNIDLSTETWYFAKCMDIILDTGYCVETYKMCEHFYYTKGEDIRRNNCPAATWKYFTCMWLWCVRIRNLESADMWNSLSVEYSQVHIVTNVFSYYSIVNFNTMLKLIEGLIICLTMHIDERSLTCIETLEKVIKSKFKLLAQLHDVGKEFFSKYYLMQAYFKRVKGNIAESEEFLKKGLDYATKYQQKIVKLIILHQQKFWDGTLDPELNNCWIEHAEDFQTKIYPDEAEVIFPFSLPLPKYLTK